MKTLKINTLEWFDKVNGNTYFASTITIDGKDKLYLPFQYGYGSQHEYEVVNLLKKTDYIPKNAPDSLWRMCNELGIEKIVNVTETKKSELLKIGQS